MIRDRGALLALAALWAGCGSDTGAEPSGDGGAVLFTATVIDSSAAVTTPIAGLTVQVVDNQTCRPTGMSTVSTADGRISFTDLPGDAQQQVAFLVEGRAPDYIDTWSYNAERDMQDEQLRAVPELSAQLTPSLAEFTEDAAQGPVAGAVYVGKNSKQRTPVGCVTVKVEGDDANDTIRYFSGNLPQAGLSETHPDNGRFFVGNLSPGRHTVQAYHGDQLLGSASLCITARNASTTGKNVSLVAIYLDANPTPDCK
jgi:hypothetical protein